MLGQLRTHVENNEIVQADLQWTSEEGRRRGIMLFCKLQTVVGFTEVTARGSLVGHPRPFPDLTKAIRRAQVRRRGRLWRCRAQEGVAERAGETQAAT